MSDVITRFAPSPTGRLHIGGARTALFCWAFARRHGGRLLLRLEDTDRARSSRAYELALLDDLAWLGIDWDEGPELTLGDAAGNADALTLGGDPRDVGPFRQSERLDLYNQHIERLIDAGLAYHAFDTAAELNAKRDAATKAKQTYRYDRAALDIPEADRKARAAAGDEHVVRFRVPDGEGFAVHDAVLGEVSFAPGELEDFIIRKRDGFPTYHFAVVVDDGLMGVTHVLRGQEHLTNTPKHVALQRALGFAQPVYAHMPLIFNERGAKMSKRERDQAAREQIGALIEAGSADYLSPVEDTIDSETYAAWLKDKKRQLQQHELDAIAGAFGLTLPEVSVEDFRAAGYLPEVVTNFIALLGWTPPKADDGSDVEKFDMEFLADRFSLEKIGKSPARFDRRKLLNFNMDASTGLETDAFAERFVEWAADYAPELSTRVGADKLAMLARVIQPQSKTFADCAGRCAFAAQSADEIVYDAKAVKKNLTRNDAEGLKVLAQLKPKLEEASDFSASAMTALIAGFCEQTGLGMGKVAQPLRVALTGTPVSPPIGETLAALGKDEVLARVNRAEQIAAERLAEAGA